MKNFIEFVKNNKITILTILLVFFFFRSCTKSVKVTKLEKFKNDYVSEVDSLNNIIKLQKDTLILVPEMIIKGKLDVHYFYNDLFGRQDRSSQLMLIHKITLNEIEKLKK